MANLNKVMLIGRLTRDPEVRTFSNGGKVVNIGFAVSNKKKDQITGDWVDDPVFVDLKMFSGADNTKRVDLVSSLQKGSQLFVEGHLVLEQWESDGQKRQKLVTVIDNFQFLDPRGEQQAAPKARTQRQDNFDDGPPSEDIPF